ncbi:MAG: SWIM zinc finger family protein [Gordonia sp. (in: high G+C Gram-positive bacteria)]
MGDRWSSDQVLALAPDAASVKAGQKLATPTPWSGTGAHGHVVWGLCKGSGKNPYQTLVDTSAPAYKCSCPSRKFPCKHALGLLLCWSAGEVPEAAEMGEAAATWMAGRTTRAATKSEPSATPKDPEQAARTAAARAERIRSGLDELRLWLGDQVGHGLAGLQADAHTRFDEVGARLVDAQAGTLANRVRRLPALVYTGGTDWPAGLLEEFGRLWSLAAAHDRLDELPDDLAHTVRRHIGYAVSRADVLATAGVDDTWLVVGRRDGEEAHLQSRATWLRGAGTGRYALVLDYAPTGATLPARPVVGALLRVPLHFYPGGGHRCLYEDPPPTPEPGPTAGSALPTFDDADLAAARRARAAALVADPWLTNVPVTLTGRLARTADGSPALLDDAGCAVLLIDVDHRWPQLLAVSAGRRLQMFGQLGADGLDPMSVCGPGQVIAV